MELQEQTLVAPSCHAWGGGGLADDYTYHAINRDQRGRMMVVTISFTEREQPYEYTFELMAILRANGVNGY